MVYPDVYKGSWGGSNCRDSPIQVSGRNCACEEKECIASEKYFDDFKETFQFSLPYKHNIAAFVAESIQVPYYHTNNAKKLIFFFKLQVLPINIMYFLGNRRNSTVS